MMKRSTSSSQQSTQEQEQQGPSKRLRLTEPDLRVIVRDNKDPGSAAREYRCHAVLLAAQSASIDTMLSSPMRESRERVIHFADLDSDTWEAMMEFSSSPVKARQMNCQDAQKLATAYDKYDFTEGRKCCDLVLAEQFKNALTSHGSSTRPDDLEALIDTYLLADTAHLPITKAAGKKYFQKTMNDLGQCGRIMFTESMLQRLVPLIVEDDLLDAKSTGWTKERVTIPSFPSNFVTIATLSTYQTELQRAVSAVEVSGTGNTQLDGLYHREYVSNTFLGSHHVTWGNAEYSTFLARLGNDWAIYGKDNQFDKRVFWMCPYSSNWRIVPPRSGWVQTDVSNDGGKSVMIRYIYGPLYDTSGW